MTNARPSVADEIDRYLRTGDTDPHYAAWPGGLSDEPRRPTARPGHAVPAPDYFAEGDPFADFIVHEAAHIFHNCKRGTAGLRQTRRKEWLLDIDFRQRETFAYSCEAYARILARAKTPGERRALAHEYGSTVRISENRVDASEVAKIVLAAADARNGWKVILARCAPTSRPLSAAAYAKAIWAAEAAARVAGTPETRQDA